MRIKYDFTVDGINWRVKNREIDVITLNNKEIYFFFKYSMGENTLYRINFESKLFEGLELNSNYWHPFLTSELYKNLSLEIN